MSLLSESRPYQTVSSQIVWSCPWYAVRQDQIVTPDGNPGVDNVVTLPGAVWVVPVTTAGEVVLIRTYRYTVDDWCLEVPAGGIKANHTAADTAQAELREEVGGTAAALAYVGHFYTMNGVGNEIAHIFFATGVTLGTPQREATEVMQVTLTPIPEALALAANNQISDGPSALALLLCAERLHALATERENGRGTTET